jgi:hypothetical protein
MSFKQDSSDGRSRAYRRVGEQYADACVIQRQSLGGGSVMVWGGITAHGRTPLVVVAGNLTGMRYGMKLSSLISFINILLCQIVTYYSRNMWSSIVLLKCDVVGLSLDERNDIRLDNFIRHTRY